MPSSAIRNFAGSTLPLVPQSEQGIRFFRISNTRSSLYLMSRLTWASSRMRYLRGKLTNGRIFIKVGIRPFQAGHPVDGYSQPLNLTYTEFTALVDTGARRTCVSENVVQRLGLTRRGKVDIWNVKRSEEHYTYLFHVGIWPETEDGSPSTIYGLGDEIEGIDVGNHPYFDVLLGMDIIMRGSMSLNHDGTFEFAFR